MADEKKADVKVEAKAPEAPKTDLPVLGETDLTKAKGNEQDVLPKTPEEIAERGTEIANSGDEAAGGFVQYAARKAGEAPVLPAPRRLWSLDTDHTTDNRNAFDPLKPDMVEHF